MNSYETYEVPCPDKSCGKLVDLEHVPYQPESEDEEGLVFWEGRCPGCGRQLQLMGEVEQPPVAQA